MRAGFDGGAAARIGRYPGDGFGIEGVVSLRSELDCADEK